MANKPKIKEDGGEEGVAEKVEKKMNTGVMLDNAWDAYVRLHRKYGKKLGGGSMRKKQQNQESFAAKSGNISEAWKMGASGMSRPMSPLVAKRVEGLKLGATATGRVDPNAEIKLLKRKKAAKKTMDAALNKQPQIESAVSRSINTSLEGGENIMRSFVCDEALGIIGRARIKEAGAPSKVASSAAKSAGKAAGKSVGAAAKAPMAAMPAPQPNIGKLNPDAAAYGMKANAHSIVTADKPVLAAHQAIKNPNTKRPMTNALKKKHLEQQDAQNNPQPKYPATKSEGFPIQASDRNISKQNIRESKAAERCGAFKASKHNKHEKHESKKEEHEEHEKGGEKGEVEMGKKEFKKEHLHLFRVLKKGGKKERHAELKKQKKEYKEEVKESGNPVNKMKSQAVKIWQEGGMGAGKVGEEAAKFRMGKQNMKFMRRKKAV